MGIESITYGLWSVVGSSLKCDGFLFFGGDAFYLPLKVSEKLDCFTGYATRLCRLIETEEGSGL